MSRRDELVNIDYELAMRKKRELFKKYMEQLERGKQIPYNNMCFYAGFDAALEEVRQYISAHKLPKDVYDACVQMFEVCKFEEFLDELQGEKK